MQDRDAKPLTLYLLHFLGGSARTWAPVIAEIAGLHGVGLDLPGFGDAAGQTGFDVAAMADAVARRIRADRPARWALAGHSMGAKVAAALARRAEDGEPGLEGLTGLVLVGGSPPAPEPMAESRRTTMLAWFTGPPHESRAQAEDYIRTATAHPLPAPAHAQAVDDVLRAARPAWVAWLERGSREDWSSRIGTLRTPCLLVAGAEDADLGPQAQAALMAPHFAGCRLITLPGAAHLMPLEQPQEIARLLVAHLLPPIGIDPAYRAFIESPRVSARTRALLLERAQPDDPGYAPVAIDPAHMAILRAVLHRVLPQPGPARIDLAARLDAQLPAGDGWRPASLPPDAAAYAAGLATLEAFSQARHQATFTALPPPEQDVLLTHVADGSALPGALDPAQMKLWFEDLRGDAVRLYMAHPATLSRIGYSGIGYGGDGEPKSGFVALGPGRREPWEPQAHEPMAPEPVA